MSGASRLLGQGGLSEIRLVDRAAIGVTFTACTWPSFVRIVQAQIAIARFSERYWLHDIEKQESFATENATVVALLCS
jgi:hypothetical protein